MRILEFVAENYKRIRIVEIRPKNHVTQITGANGQGKTSVLDGMFALFEGKRAIPERPVRKGAEKSRLQATLGDENGKPLLIAKRTIASDRTTTLTIEAAPGAVRPIGTPQAVLDELIGNMSFDPLAFMELEPAHQAQRLRSLVKVDVDLEALTKENEADFTARTEVNREVTRLKGVISGMVVQSGLPAEKIDEAAILAELNNAGARNKEIEGIRVVKANLGLKRMQAENAKERAQEKLSQADADLLAAIEKQRQAVEAMNLAKDNLVEAQKAYNDAPDAEYVETSILTERLQTAQVTNREIDKRTNFEKLQAQLAEQTKFSQDYTRAIEFREQQKSEAMQRAAMPMDGLSFTEAGVWYNQIPLKQMGEADQLRICLALSMAANPKLRAVPIHRGEALDTNSLALIEKMAEENDFQIFMSRVDTSGTVGIVLSDGMVESDNQE